MKKMILVSAFVSTLALVNTGNAATSETDDAQRKNLIAIRQTHEKAINTLETQIAAMAQTSPTLRGLQSGTKEISDPVFGKGKETVTVPKGAKESAEATLKQQGFSIVTMLRSQVAQLKAKIEEIDKQLGE